MYRVGWYVIVPSHGLGKLTNKITQKVGEQEQEFLEIFFESDNMKMLIPFTKAKKSGIRTPVSKEELTSVFEAMKEDSRGMRVIWSKRSREYNKKILTGDIYAVAEVVRDLFRNTNNPNRSYSERVIFENALQRLSAEVGVVQGISEVEAEEKILNILSKYHETYQDTIAEEHIDIDEIEPLPQNL
ncbi:MAG: CarD family transcriptional regulator [Candidatus Deianiraeaceae bacterium]|jgi:CarD family transcriptional regulator